MRKWNFIVCSLVALLTGLASAPLQGEHRFALLIGNSAYQDKSLKMPAANLKAVAAAFQKHGFRCTVAENLDEKKLKYAIEAFADTTPTRGTALLYFAGQVFPGSYNGKPGLCMLGTNSRKGRGFTIEQAFELLHGSGGSSLNLVIADSPGAPVQKVQLPQGCTLVFKDPGKSLQATLASNLKLQSKASVSVSSPDKFVLGKKAGDEWVNSKGMIFCWCPPGTYTAGSAQDTPGRYPDEQQKQVVIEQGFWISKYELTLSQNLRGRSAPHRSISRHKLDPLTMVNYDDARSMTSRSFSGEERKHGRLAKDWEYNLPTEAQWEYAARAGTEGQFYFGDDLKQLPKHANFADKTFYDSKDVFSNAAHRTLADGAVRLAKVGTYEPNPWGLHDVYGNVAEWCVSTATRGGSWATSAENCRNAYRHTFSSRREQNFIGYRIVIQKTPPPKPKSQNKK